ncbi:MAG: DMT family transporter [Clostridiales bacterium]|jgi:drug/metabolite transporter (DMT)-like permease|nr:DMT family transporter [Clostridiales bacterium]
MTTNKQKSLRSKIMPYIAAGGTVLFWSSAFPAVKFSLDYFSPEALMLFRFFIATALLLTYCAIKKVPLPERKDLPLFITCGFVGLFLYMWAFNTGTDMVTSGISGFIIAAAPVFTLIMTIVFLKEKAGATVWAGVLVSFAGIVIIAMTQVTDFEVNFGVWLLLSAAVSAGVFIVIQRHLLKKYSVMQVTAYPIAIGTLFMCVFLPNLIRELPTAPMTANIVVAYLGLFPAAIAYFMWGYALNRAEKTVYVTSFLYLSPFLTIIIAFFWLGEHVPPLAFVGGVVVVIGMIITKIKPRKS